MSSSSNVNTRNIELSPMRVTYNGVDLGGTEGGVDVSMKTKTAAIKVDQFGDTEVDSVVSGQEYMVKLTLVESKDKGKWKVAFPFIRLIDNGTDKQMYFEVKVGTHLLDLAQALVLHPQSKDDSDKAGDFLFYKAVAKSATELKFGPDKQVGLQVEFMIYPDTTTTPARYLVHGDPAIGAVNATAAAAVAGGTNVGNGTVGTISTGTKTKTETLTVTCLGATGGKFSITGSVSGIIGIATAGTAFSSAAINLTVTQGATPFAVGDNFSIATVSANYA